MEKKRSKQNQASAREEEKTKIHEHDDRGEKTSVDRGDLTATWNIRPGEIECARRLQCLE